MIFLRFQPPNISTPLGMKSPKSNQFLFTSRLNFVPNLIAIGWMLRPAAHSHNCDTYIHIYIYYYKLLNRWRFWGLGAMIGETMMIFSGSRTMRVSAIDIFLRNQPKNRFPAYLLCNYIERDKMDGKISCIHKLARVSIIL